jgi:hypothetical protein
MLIEKLVAVVSKNRGVCGRLYFLFNILQVLIKQS